jgi:protein farnesyltransferase subunit beta
MLLKSIKIVDQYSLLKWLTGRQMKLEGGFQVSSDFDCFINGFTSGYGTFICTLRLQGRTNKLVDGCYSFWQGASFCLLGPGGVGFTNDNGRDDAHWLFNQVALQEYVLICCQHPAGGLIDKPGK